MIIRILAVGRKHEPWVEIGIERFFKRLRPPFQAKMDLIPHSGKSSLQAAEEESNRLIARIRPDDFVILLDETGDNLSSPELSKALTDNVDRQVVLIIGGAFGVTDHLSNRADLVWSLSRLVFPHQLVRLILAEQLYRAQEIHRGSDYHHV